MKSFMITLLCLLAAVCTPGSVCAQNLQMLVDGKNSSQVALEDLHMDVKVTGSIAATTWTMVFRNSSNRALEAELTFPLPEGITVSHYAIDINGKLRDAVPVEKAKGITTLEAIEHKRIDPGLLERVEGNAFRTRIYPLPARGTRTVLIGYEELLQSKGNKLEYRLPISFQREIPRMTISAVSYSEGRPEALRNSTTALNFTRRGAAWIASKVIAPFHAGEPLTFRISQPKEPAVLMQGTGNHYHCLINIPPCAGNRERSLPKDITILWDASLSGLHRDHNAELELLDGYLRRVATATINLIVFSNTVQPMRSFSIRSGDWHLLREALEHVTYDGGTQLGGLDLRKLPGREFLLFSDGLSTYGPGSVTTGIMPVYCINAAPNADFAALRYISATTGGQLIDLTRQARYAALEQLTTQPLQFLGVLPDAAVEEVYPNVPMIAENGASISAIIRQKKGELTLLYGYGTVALEERKVAYDAGAGTVNDVSLARIWAAQKIAMLDRNYDQHKSEIERLGKRYGLVTRNTSLIVLENLADYLRYEIEPPAELRNGYDKSMKERGERIAEAAQDRVEMAEISLDSLKEWWNPKPKPAIAASITPPKLESSRPVTSVPAIAATGSGGIEGMLVDERGTPVVNAGVMVSEAGIQKARGLTDFDGNYNIHPLSGGRYDVRFSYIGRTLTITNVVVAANQFVAVNARMATTTGTEKAKAVEVHATRSYQAPIIDPENPGGRQVVTAEQIERAPIRNTSDIAALSTQVYQGAGGGLRIGGGRTSGNEYVVDGVQLAENFADEAMGYARYTSASGSFIDEGAPLFGLGERRRQRHRMEAYRKSMAALSTIARLPDSYLLDSVFSMPDDEQYATYLALRQARLGVPSFYFQAAARFIEANKTDIGLCILSNLAELELENYELYKMLGYKLREMGETEAALEAFRKVLLWRPMDPQSRRDYALALADAGFYEAAVDTLYAALTAGIDPSLEDADEGIEETLLCDINGIITQHPEALAPAIPARFIQHLSADLRIVLNWNMKNTDIDLWITDPNGEKCYYAHRRTAIGGRLSDDFTEGFGPEQFLLRNAIPGRYKVEVDYYGDDQVKIAGPTTVMAETYTGWEKPEQKRQIVVMQMKPDQQGAALIGEFELGRMP